jgi:hypothetical protein
MSAQAAEPEALSNVEPIEKLDWYAMRWKTALIWLALQIRS